MKKTVALMALMLLAQQAQAACLNFVNGKGPRQIGNVPLVATATQVCIENHNRFAGSTVTVMKFADAEGELASFTTELKASGRGLGILKIYELKEGTSNGQYAPASGVEVSIEAPQDPHLRIPMGKLTIKAGRDFPQSYLVIGNSIQ